MNASNQTLLSSVDLISDNLQPFIGMVGTDFNTASLKLRDAICFIPHSLDGFQEVFPPEAAFVELVVMATCNRVELYFVSANPQKSSQHLLEMISGHCGVTPQRLEQSVSMRFGHDAVEHIFRVAGGLESMVLGESEIIGQVRKSYFRSLKNGSTASLLNRLFQQAIKTGKRIRSETALCCGEASISSVALTHAAQQCGDLSGKKILIVGAGRMAQRLAERLQKDGKSAVWVTNRTEKRAELFASHFGFQHLPYPNWQNKACSFDLIFLACSSTTPVLSVSDLENRQHPLSIIDIGAPANADPRIAEIQEVSLMSIDHLRQTAEISMQQRKCHLGAAENIIAQEQQEFERWHRYRATLHSRKKAAVRQMERV